MKENKAHGLDKLIQINKKLINSSIIGTCSYQPGPSKNKQILTIQKMIKSIIDLQQTHYVRDCHKWIQCKNCEKMWCCQECAIEDNAITGLKQYRKKIVCLKCRDNKNE